MSTINTAVILLALVAANLPWFSERLFYLIPMRDKHLGWRLLELLALYFSLGGVTYLAERYTAGQVAPQHWEFYATTAALFIVFAFPGFIWRYLWRK
jgi:hypothetical protein